LFRRDPFDFHSLTSSFFLRRNPGGTLLLEFGFRIPSGPKDPSLSDFDFDVVFGDPNCKALRALSGRWTQDSTGFDVEPGTMPGAAALVARDHAPCQRPAAVRARILDGIIVAAQIENGDFLPTHLHELSGFYILKLCFGSDFDKPIHSDPLPPRFRPHRADCTAAF